MTAIITPAERERWTEEALLGGYWEERVEKLLAALVAAEHDRDDALQLAARYKAERREWKRRAHAAEAAVVVPQPRGEVAHV